MRSLTKRIWGALLAAGLCLAVAQAQDQTPPTKPVPPTSPLPPAKGQDTKQAGSTGQESREEPTSPALGTNPVVTGGLAPRAGEIGETQSQILFGFRAGELIDTNYANSTTPGGGVDSVTSLSGHFDMHRMRSNSDWLFRYVGGGLIDAKNSQFNSTFHEFEASETIQFRRWTLKLDDIFSYLPESAFGYGGGGPSGATLLGVTFIDPSVTPNQSIFTPQAKRLSNTALGQAQILKSERTTLTITVSYGLLHYITPGFLDSSNYSVGAGYNYSLGPRDIIGISYTFYAYRFNPALASINDSTFLVTYGHQITGRLAIQGGIGPEFNSYMPVGGPSAGTRFAWSANAGLSYNYNRTTLGGSFSRGVSGGGGVLLGAVTNTFQFSAGRQLGQWWSVNGNIGYAFNQSLAQASSILSSYNGLNAGVGATRRLGERSSIFFNYNFFHQSTNVVCVGPTCAAPFNRNQFWVGFNFDFRPIGIR